MRLLVLVVLAGCGGSDGSSCPLLAGKVSAACTGCSAPAAIAPADSLATELVLTPDMAAWLQSESVEVFPLAGGTATELGEALGGLPRLRAAGARLAWLSNGEIHTYAPSEPIHTVTMSPLVSMTRDFAIDDTALYLPIDQGGVHLAALAFDGTTQRVWSIEPLDVIADPGGPLVTTCTGVYRAPDTGTVAMPLLDRFCGISLAATPSYIFAGGFFSDCDSWGIVRFDRTTRVPQTLLLDDKQYTRLATDGAFVYFTNQAGLFRISVEGGEPAMLLPGPIGSFAVDATAIYALAGGSLLKITKRP